MRPGAARPSKGCWRGISGSNPYGRSRFYTAPPDFLKNEAASMSKRYVLPMSVLANASMLLLCLLSRYDLIPFVFFLPVVHALLFFLNLKAANRWYKVILLNDIHITATACTILLDGRIHMEYVARADLVDAAFSVIAFKIGIVLTLILFIIHMIIFARKKRNRQDA